MIRILFDQSVHDHRNRGNNSLLEVTRDRFKSFWPDAEIDVISNSPYFCRIYLDGVRPVDVRSFSEFRGRFALLYQYLPKSVLKLLFEVRELFKKRFSSIRSATRAPEDDFKADPSSSDSELLPAETPLENAHSKQLSDFSSYDLYVPTGGGYMCDSDKRFILPLLERIESAKAHGKFVFMVGQGIGPLEDPEIIERARKVLPTVDYILTREELLTRPLLQSLDVPREKVLMTGDDAIELAYRAHKSVIGNGIGLSLRVTAYTDFNQAHIEAIRPVIFNAAKKHDSVLISAPIDSNDADKEYVAKLMRGYGKTSSTWKKFETTTEIIERISRCRVMITGTFHGAVFAISQGIPVIGLAKTIEYKNKISGLAAEFGGEGCQIIDLKEPNFTEHLAESIEVAWTNAENLRPHLLQQAKRQIDLGNNAYRRIQAHVESELSHLIR